MTFCSGGCVENETKKTNAKRNSIDKDLNQDTFKLVDEKSDLLISLNKLE